MKLYKPVADPHLQIRGEPGHPDPEITGGGGGGGGGPSPGSITAKVTVKIEIVQKVKHSKKYICL